MSKLQTDPRNPRPAARLPCAGTAMLWIRLPRWPGATDTMRWRRPVFEATEVFARTLGETSDVVTKEMYSFETKGGDSVTLRPENTAGVARAVISNGLQQSLPLRYFLCRPDVPPRAAAEGPAAPVPPDRHRTGRGVSPSARRCRNHRSRRRCAGCAWRAGTDNAGAEHAGRYRKPRRLPQTGWSAIFPRYRDDLSEDSRRRLDVNPLRILDSKNTRDREIVARCAGFSATR